MLPHLQLLAVQANWQGEVPKRLQKA